MAGIRLPGVLCVVTNSLPNDSGTLVRGASDPPGIVDGTNKRYQQSTPGSTNLAQLMRAGEIVTEAGALDLEYEVVAKSLTFDTPAYKTVAKITDTLGKHGASYFVHGNNRIRIKNAPGGTELLNMYRVFRVWAAPLDPSTHRRTGPYRTGDDAEIKRFINDGTGGSVWIDVPGQQVPMSVKARPKERYLTEFLVGIKGRPDVGGLYFIVVVDVTPSEYQVSMYSARRYSGEDWKNAVFPKGFEFWGDSDNASVEKLSKTAPDTDETTAKLLSNYGGWQKFP